MGDPGGQAYVMVSGRVRVTTVDEDQQEVVVDEPAHGILRLRVDAGADASSNQRYGHGRYAMPGVRRGDIATLLHASRTRNGYADGAGTAVSRAQQLVRLRAMRNANEVIEEKSTLPDRIADSMVQFGGSWTFIVGFLILSSIYTAIT